LLTRCHSLRRRFEQNQEDCTFTVLALLPTATTNILEAMNTEKITYDIQQMKGSIATTKSVKSIGSTSPPSTTDANTVDEDGRSVVSLPSHSDSNMSVSQIMGLPPLEGPKAPAPAPAPAAQESAQPKPRRTKRQLWDDLTISGE
jgi:peroxin-3